ncbi:cytochrome ubiquinol oxidase subunit I [Winogradskya consettensis]|uniref:Cytochrome ubiquinol oxidase subunit I n=1 Tax=Winogradskya consettensis TaxID=113560 RepID=A0A919VUV9_9ACTN|nr:cytochrome ubiquinol oxidase subunit I [Actinoplanes consettensis]GIM79869.1 cytochrome ubiquinol oxidase subunit I [Actinoplanes consettensis]
MTARVLMGGTLGFHIILACLGIALPTLVLIAEGIGLRRGNDTAMLLARRWSQALAVLVAVGAVTGTVLSFEMSLLWPGLMAKYGAVLGLPFGFEGIFFLLEAVFTAIYVYGWRRLRGWTHWWTGVPVAVSGIAGAASVVAVNAWMNQPGGFTVVDGRITQVRPLEVFFNHAFFYEVPHMTVAAYLVTGFLTAGVYAYGWLKGRRDRYHRLGFLIPFVLAGVLAPVEFLLGDVAARAVAHDQPVKFAAMEYVTTTGAQQPEYLGGIYLDGTVYGGIPIPDMDSVLVGFSPRTVVTGLDSVPTDLRPPSPTLLHLSFDTMVGIGTLLILLPLWALVVWRRRRSLPGGRLFWWAAVVAGPAAVVAMECGWIVTEVGRQPWVVYGYLTTADAMTSENVVPALVVVVLVYTVLGAATLALLRRMAAR